METYTVFGTQQIEFKIEDVKAASEEAAVAKVTGWDDAKILKLAEIENDEIEVNEAEEE